MLVAEENTKPKLSTKLKIALVLRKQKRIACGWKES